MIFPSPGTDPNQPAKRHRPPWVHERTANKAQREGHTPNVKYHFRVLQFNCHLATFLILKYVGLSRCQDIKQVQETGRLRHRKVVGGKAVLFVLWHTTGSRQATLRTLRCNSWSEEARSCLRGQNGGEWLVSRLDGGNSIRLRYECVSCAAASSHELFQSNRSMSHLSPHFSSTKQCRMEWRHGPWVQESVAVLVRPSVAAFVHSPITWIRSSGR